MKKTAILLISLIWAFASNAQVGIGTTIPSSNSILDLTASNKGFLLPRITTAQRTAMTPDAITDKGMQVFDTTTNSIWYWDGILWRNENSYSYLVNQPNTWYVQGTTTYSTTNAENIWRAGRVGINTNTPSYPLDIIGDARVSNKYRFSDTGITLYGGVTGYLGLYASDQTTLTGLRAGTVSIGKTTNAQPLDVVGNVAFSGALMPNNSNGNSGEVLTSAGANTPPTWTTVGVPTSAIYYLATSTVPSGYLECNGQAVSRTTYATLFSFIGSTFGSGDGSTTFNVPDLRGQFVRGWDHAREVDTGRVFGSSQTDTLQNITGNFWGAGNNAANGAFAGTGTIGSWLQFGNGYPDVSNYNFDASRVARTSTETRPKNIALLPVIKY
ncbi:phage tail protein [Flavobacterium sp. SUN046]|uniref:phage tail protein n=1 Tax=Flavobacterium sp. SUN046 TaxID=3002440 RepID=UPI002DB79490|nr:phage tail protein [Flavobacterium sp. SUN046]MEC4049947.1 phage tail protein [Flavobacterium sp. SUN046]